VSRESSPLFIVGAPRSGTTLLRNVLHGHDEIALTAYESHFVPSLLLRHGARPQIATRREVSTFLAEFKRGLLYCKGCERGVFLPSDAELATAAKGETWATVLRGLFDLYCDKRMNEVPLWGDKTPAYVDHIDFISAALPKARFVHIIRDPRDQALSARAIWGKSLRSSADRWRASIVRARASRANTEGRYVEVTYERLVRTPESELRRLTSWLGVDFQSAMLTSVAGSDELGQMIGAKEISTEAIAERQSSLRPEVEATIAALAGDIARPLGYDLPVVDARHLPAIERRVLALHDRLGLIAYFVRQKGLADGLRFSVGSLHDHQRV